MTRSGIFPVRVFKARKGKLVQVTTITREEVSARIIHRIMNPDKDILFKNPSSELAKWERINQMLDDLAKGRSDDE